MRIGLRLPGPFRVSVNSRGRVSGGVTLGPVSLSGYIGGGRRAADGSMFMPGWTTQGAAQALQAEGWKVSMAGYAVMASQGWTAIAVRPARGGVTVERVTSTRVALIWVALTVAVAGFCAISAALM